ncbi:MAG TPA: PmoA family protein [Chthonomonadaceae bacterium]|nr:PmoA family protein [Chthonomonadaceae bacterium]
MAWAVQAQVRDVMPTVTVRAPNRAYHNAVVSVVLPPAVERHVVLHETDALFLEAPGEKPALPCQIEREGQQPRLTFLLPDLPKGAKRVYHLRRAPRDYRPTQAVSVTQQAEDLEIRVGGKLFARYTTQSGPNKPFFYPILTPEGANITRRWPMEQTTGESHDHPHHRGLWFTHGSVNGIDFWSEGKGTGKTVNKAFQALTSGPVYGGFRAATEWRAPDDRLIATDTRQVAIIPLPNGDRLLDFTIVITPADGPLVFGDTKEGMFGLRLADALAPARKQGGHIKTSTGNEDAAAWGKPAEWVDDWGPIQNQTYGVAIFDAPDNLRHPQTWHARDYGLFCVNPFGLHDFGLGAKGAGDYTVPAGKSLTLRYRLLFHKGDTISAGVAEQYAQFADPPQVEAKW